YPDMLLLAVLAMTIHVFSNHKYVGHLLVILAILGMGFVSALGFERNLYQYSGDSGSVYSDMNGWGPYRVPYFCWTTSWVAFAVVLLVLTNLFWMRGEETRLRWRA